jgi:hypothetical protein
MWNKSLFGCPWTWENVRYQKVFRL